MVCPRCIMAIETALTRIEIRFVEVKLGSVDLAEPISPQKVQEFKKAIESLGFELLSDNKTRTIEKIKNAIINMVHHQDDVEKIGHLSEQLPQIIGQSYSALSKLFSEVEGLTIEKFLILQKIEKAKELLVYDELNISQIAYRLNYSSSQHFSSQFKSITGLSPSLFIKMKTVKRRPINEI
jgi:AraC family transcriptional regulator